MDNTALNLPSSASSSSITVIENTNNPSNPNPNEERIPTDEGVVPPRVLSVGEELAGAIADANGTGTTDGNNHGPKSALVGVDGESMQTLMLRKRKETRELNELLEKTQTLYHKQMNLLQQREDLLHTKSQEMQATLARMKPFIEENDNKKRRAYEKAQIEHRAIQTMELDISKYRTELMNVKNDEKFMQNELGKLVRYEYFLRTVMEVAADRAETFGEVKDILTRYTTLQSTNIDLQKTTENLLTTLEKTRLQVSTAATKMKDTALVTGSAVQALSQRLEEVRSELVELQSLQESVDNQDRKSRSTMGVTDASIRNLVNRVIVTAPSNCLAVASVVHYASSSSSKEDMDLPLEVVDHGGSDNTNSSLLKSEPGAYLVTALHAIGERLTDLIAIKAEYNHWKLQKEAELLQKAAQQDPNNPNSHGTSSRPSTVPSSSSVVGVGSGASAVRAMSARNRGVSTSTSGPLSSSSSNNNLHTSISNHPNGGPLQPSRKYSVNSLMTNSIDGGRTTGGSVNGGGSQLGMSVSFSVAGSSSMFGAHINNNHPPGIYRTNFVLPGGDRGGNNVMVNWGGGGSSGGGGGGGGKIEGSGMLHSSSSRGNPNHSVRGSAVNSSINGSSKR